MSSFEFLRIPAALALSAAILGGCGELPRPFQPEAKTLPVVRPVSPEAAALLREKVLVAVQPVANLAGEGGARLAAAMAVALRNEGVAADLDPQGPSYTLAGIATVREVPHELEVKVTWFLLDPKGYRLTQQEQTTRGRIDDFIDGNDRLISRIAQSHAPLLAAMINQQTAQANPPRTNGAVAAPPPAAPIRANGSPQPPPEKPGERKPAAAAPAGGQQPPPQQAAAPEKPQQLRILVPRVSGAPGDGSESLTAGMKRALGRRDFAIVNKSDGNTLTVRGKVEMAPFNNNRQTITITWAVLDPQNRQVGEIEQSNVIPAGSLDGVWGDVAREITVAAAEGLLDLLDKASKAARQ